MAKEGKTAVVPKLRFPEYRETAGWDVLPMGRLLSLEYGASLPEYSRHLGPIPVMGSNGVVGFHDEASVKGPAIVIGRKGSVGEVNWIDTDCCPIDTTYYIANKQPTSSSMQFLYRLLQCSKLNQRGDPGAVPGLNRSAVHSLQTAIPKPPEQQKIADCLSSLDELIAAQGRKVEALKTYKRGLMQQLFPREGETLPRLRFPEFRDAPEWESTTLGSLVHFQSGCTPSRANPEFWNGSIPWVSAKDMKRLFLDDAEDHISASGVKDGAKVLPMGTVLILVRGMTLLKDVPICVLRNEMSFNQDVKALLPKGETDGLFAALLLLGNKQRLLGMVDIAGHGTGKLNTDELNALELVAPKPDEQQRIAGFLSSLDVHVATEADKFAALKTHRNGLMQQLFPAPEAPTA